MRTSLLLVGPVAPPPGGVAAHVAALARALAARGLRATVIDPGRGKARFAAALAAAALARRRVHVHVCGHNRSSWALVAACAAAGARPVVTVHSGLAPAYLAALRPAARAAVGTLLATSAAVVCVSDAVAAAARAAGAPAARLVVASPFIPEALAPGPAPPAAAAHRAAFGRLVAAAVAPGVEYGADLLVAGFARLAAVDPEAGLVVFGPGGADRAAARALAARGFGDRVRCAGELDHAAALGLVAACDLFVRPTRADGDALSLREALALGRRAVASDAAARPPGVVTYPAEDPAALAAALAVALAGPLPAPRRDGGLPVLISLYERLGLLS